MNLNIKNTFLYFLCSFLFFCGCTKESVESKIKLEGYHIEQGFNLEVAASEPLIISPISLDFDNQGRLWVLEMPGYMPNIDGTGEEEPVGRIMILEDQNKDGHFEKAKPFLDNLVLARAMKLCYGGLLYAEPPNLWFVEINNDKPGKKTLVDPEYIAGGNVEHQPNGLDLNIDNWIYSAKGRFRYRLRDGKWLKEETTFRGQWGISHDDEGRLFYNDNSNPLYGDFVLPNQLNQNPLFKNNQGENEVILNNRKVYPIQATAVNRGYIDGMLDDRNYLKSVTSACGPVVYRGDQFSKEHQGNAFVCAPEVNLVKRVILSEEGTIVKGVQAYQDKEFLISEDEAFRPVNIFNGPDGAMYIVDYHHGIIQHKVYMTAYLRELYLERGLDTIVDYGRILRVSQGDGVSVTFHDKANAELVELLNHKNGWVRDRAQHILVADQAMDVLDSLKVLAKSKEKGFGPLHAIWTLEGLNELDQDLLLEIVQSEFPARVKAAIQLVCKTGDFTQVDQTLQKAIDQNNRQIDWSLITNIPNTGEKSFVMIEELLDRYPNDTLFIESALSNLRNKEKQFHYYLTVVRGKPSNYPIIAYLREIIQKSQTASTTPKNYSTYTDAKTTGLKLYRQHCGACHGEGGKGIKNLAPPIYNSNYLKGGNEKLILVVLHGLQGPIHVNGKSYNLSAVMPGLKDNKDLSDRDIADILSFVKNAFSDEPQGVKVEEVKAGREKLPRGKMYTEEELF